MTKTLPKTERLQIIKTLLIWSNSQKVFEKEALEASERLPSTHWKNQAAMAAGFVNEEKEGWEEAMTGGEYIPKKTSYRPKKILRLLKENFDYPKNLSIP